MSEELNKDGCEGQATVQSDSTQQVDGTSADAELAGDEQEPSRLRIVVQDPKAKKRSARKSAKADAPQASVPGEGDEPNAGGEAEGSEANDKAPAAQPKAAEAAGEETEPVAQDTQETELASLIDELARGNARSTEKEQWVYARYGINPQLPTVEKIRLLKRV